MTWMADGNGAYDMAESRRARRGARWSSASAGSRSRCRPTTTWPMRRWRASCRSRWPAARSSNSADDTEPYLRAGSFDLVQPDVSICGGIGGVLEIAAAARDAGRFAVPHACSGAIALAATLHVLAVLPVPPDAPKWAEPILEHDVGENPIRTDDPDRAADAGRRLDDDPGRAGARDRCRRGGPPSPGGMTLSADDGRRGAAAALDANFAELIRWYASRPGGEVVEAADVTICSTGLAVPVDQLRGRDRPRSGHRGRSDRGGRRVVRGRGLPWRWLVGPTSRPDDLGERLVRAGFELVTATAPGWRSTSTASSPRRRPPASRS